MIWGILIEPDSPKRDRSISPARKKYSPLKRNVSTSSIRTSSRHDSVSEEENRRKVEKRCQPESNRGDILILPSFILPTVFKPTGNLSPNLRKSSDPFSQNRKSIGDMLVLKQPNKGHRKTKSDDIEKVEIVSLDFLNHSYYLVLHLI